jgi:hypothetical protein
MPAAASPLERGDQLYDEGKYGQALALYQEQAIAAPKPDAGREARCKAALCLVQLNQLDGAAALLEPVAAENEGRWPLVAACRLWLIRLQQQQFAESGALFASIRARFKREELASYVPEEVKDRLLQSGKARKTDLLLPSPTVVRRTEELVHLADLLGSGDVRYWLRYHLMRVCAVTGDEARALQIIEEARPLAIEGVLASAGNLDMPLLIGRWHTWLRRRQGQTREALGELDAYSQQIADLFRRQFPNDLPRQHRAAQLLLERARLFADLNEWAQAEMAVDAFFQQAGPDIGYNEYAAAWLMKGFLCERRGAADEAQRAWKEGLYPAYRRLVPDGGPLSGAIDGLVAYSIMASLTNQLSDTEAEALWKELGPALAGDAFMAQVSSLLRPSPVVLRGTWRTANGKEAARRIAFLDAAPAEYYCLPVISGIAERFRQDALGGETTPEQEEVVWRATRTCYEQVRTGKLKPAQLVPLALAWKGNTGLIGWSGVAPQLDPALRGPLAYVFGRHCLHLNGPEGKARRADAMLFFRAARKDAPPASSLAKLVQQELARLEPK